MGWIVAAALALCAAGAALYVVGIYNGLIRLKHAVDQSWANIDVLLKQRHDELPKLIETVKGYMRHERELLTRVTEARSALEAARGVRERARADRELRGALGQLFAVAEGYPQLKADTSFGLLAKRISEIEEQIADRREFYNHSVNALNVRIEQIPDVFLARALALGPRDLFAAAPQERTDVRVSFD